MDSRLPLAANNIDPSTLVGLDSRHSRSKFSRPRSAAQVMGRSKLVTF